MVELVQHNRRCPLKMMMMKTEQRCFLMWRLPALQWAPCVQHKWGCLWWVWWPLLRASGRRSWGTQSIAWWPACRTHRSDAMGTAICLKHQLYVSVVKWGHGVKLQICVCYYTKLYLPKSKANQKHKRERLEEKRREKDCKSQNLLVLMQSMIFINWFNSLL